MHCAQGGPQQGLQTTDPVLAHYRQAIDAEALMRRLAMAIAACDGAERTRERRNLLTQEATAADRFNSAYQAMIDTHATSTHGVLAKFLLHAQCTRDGADQMDNELMASVIADIHRLNLLPMSAAMLGAMKVPDLSEALRDADAAFSQAAATTIPMTPSMLEAGARVGQVKEDQASSIFSAMWAAFLGLGSQR